MTYLRLLVAACVLSATGCGLISSDVTNFDLTLPDKKFSVDTSSWQVNMAAANVYLMQTCDPTKPPPNVCSSAVAQACQTGCSGSCDTSSRKCDLSLDVAAHQAVNLVMEKPELSTINNQPLIHVTIDSLQYEVTNNTLSIATPAITIYVAPMSIMDPNDPMAQKVGTVDPIPAMTTVALKDLTFDPSGKQNLVTIMGSYKTPFNVLAGTTLTVMDGQMLPTGKLDAIVHIKAHATL